MDSDVPGYTFHDENLPLEYTLDGYHEVLAKVHCFLRTNSTKVVADLEIDLATGDLRIGIRGLQSLMSFYGSTSQQASGQHP